MASVFVEVDLVTKARFERARMVEATSKAEEMREEANRLNLEARKMDKKARVHAKTLVRVLGGP